MFLLLLMSMSCERQVPELARDLSRSLLSVAVESCDGLSAGLGSAFVVGDGLHAVTNFHVVDGACTIVVIAEDGTREAAVLSGSDPQHDLAMLEFGTARPALRVDSSLPEVGTAVLALGNPKGVGLTISDGIVSGVRSIDSLTLIQHTAPISQGNSGGPLVDRSGVVLAVNTLQFDPSQAQNLNFAVAGNHVTEFAEKHRVVIKGRGLAFRVPEVPEFNFEMPAALTPVAPAPVRPAVLVVPGMGASLGDPISSVVGLEARPEDDMPRLGLRAYYQRHPARNDDPPGFYAAIIRAFARGDRFQAAIIQQARAEWIDREVRTMLGPPDRQECDLLSYWETPSYRVATFWAGRDISRTAVFELVEPATTGTPGPGSSVGTATIPMPTLSSTLETKNGFRDVRLGQPVDEPTFIPAEEKMLFCEQALKRPSERLSVGDADLTSVLYCAPQGSVREIALNATGNECHDLQRSLVAAFGPPAIEDDQVPAWESWWLSCPVALRLHMSYREVSLLPGRSIPGLTRKELHSCEATFVSRVDVARSANLIQTPPDL